MSFLKNFKRWFMAQRYCKSPTFVFLACVIGFIIIKQYRVSSITESRENIIPNELFHMYHINETEWMNPKDLLSRSELHIKLLKEKVERLARKVKKSRSITFNEEAVNQINYNVHIFYYAWYANKEFDGYYRHWNHSYLPNWKRVDQTLYPTGSHKPSSDIGSNYYPTLGSYSSNDPKLIDIHLNQLKNAGIGVIVISWTPPKCVDSPYDMLPLLFQYAKKYEIKIALHIEPYIDRNPINLAKYLKDFLKMYGNHTALYKIKRHLGTKEVPVVYVYDSYLLPAVAWKELLNAKGNLSIRDTDVDALFIGLLVDIQHRYHIKKSNFDGFYTYFATNSFSYGSTWKNWKSLSKFAKQNELIFIPSVGPGYIDTQVRPWNSKNTRHRRNGQYYDVAWRSAINSNTNFISITSFNEWHEGTQIEPATPKRTGNFNYLDYEPDGPYFYLNLTRWWIEQFNKTLCKNL